MNAMVHMFVDDCFFESQFMAIRRLVDNPDTYSLLTLLKAIDKCLRSMTKEKIFEAEGYVHDIINIKNKEDEYCAQEIRKNNMCFYIPPELDPNNAIRNNQRIEQIVKIKENNVLISLIDRLKSSYKDIKKYVDNYVAHAAKPEIRKRQNAEDVRLTLASLWNVHRILCRTANFISYYFLEGAYLYFLPMPDISIFWLIEKPLVTPDKIAQLSGIWSEYLEETKKWKPWDLNEINSGSPGKG